MAKLGLSGVISVTPEVAAELLPDELEFTVARSCVSRFVLLTHLTQKSRI